MAAKRSKWQRDHDSASRCNLADPARSRAGKAHPSSRPRPRGRRTVASVGPAQLLAAVGSAGPSPTTSRNSSHHQGQEKGKRVAGEPEGAGTEGTHVQLRCELEKAIVNAVAVRPFALALARTAHRDIARGDSWHNGRERRASLRLMVERWRVTLDGWVRIEKNDREELLERSRYSCRRSTNSLGELKGWQNSSPLYSESFGTS